MKEAKIILPVCDNKGNDLNAIHRSLRVYLAKHFGGFTATPALGGWVNNQDILQEEKVVVYTVAVGDLSDATTALWTICRTLRKAARQDSIYYCDSSGSVHFIED